MMYMLCMYAFLSVTLILSKDLLTIINPFLMIFLRMGICSLLFGIYALAKIPLVQLSYEYGFCILVLGFFNVYIANVFQLIGLKYIDPINASLWYNSTPFVIAFFAFLFYRTKISSLKLLSLCLGWIGFFPLIWQVQHDSMNFYIYGATFFLLSACSMAISGLLLENNQELSLHSMSLTNCLSMGIGAICTLIHYYFFYGQTDALLFLTPHNYAMLIVVIGATALCASLYIYFVRKHGALLVTLAGFSLPIFSILFELLLGEKVTITPNIVVSGILITLALYLFTRPAPVPGIAGQ